MKKYFVSAASSLCLASAIAANISSVVVGDVYWLWRPDQPNQRVVVREVDRNGDRVKVALPDGEVRWVSASSLKTRDEATNTDIGVGLGVAAGVLLVCALDPSVCKSKPTQSPPPNQSGMAGIGEFIITNSCRHPIRLAVHYHDSNASTWVSDGWWSLTAGQSTYLANSSNKRLSTSRARWYYYAETSNESQLSWRGDFSKRLGQLDVPMAAIDQKEGDNKLTLACDGK